MRTDRTGHDLDDWIAKVEHDDIAPIAGFARNLRRDHDTVQAGLILEHSLGASRAPSLGTSGLASC